MPIEKLQIIRLTWKRLCEVLHTLVKSEQGPKAVMLAVMLGLLMVAINGLNVVNSFVGRYFMSAIENRNIPEFQKQTLYYVGVFFTASRRSAWAFSGGSSSPGA
jgi:putative ATP-binding cassette transporter